MVYRLGDRFFFCIFKLKNSKPVGNKENVSTRDLVGGLFTYLKKVIVHACIKKKVFRYSVNRH
jgi:hypothetical protein